MRLAGREQTKWVLEQMGTVNIGDTLPDMGFEDTEGRIRLLSELVRGNDIFLIVYIRPDCPGCIAEIESLGALTHATDRQLPFALLYSDSPYSLSRMRTERSLGNPFLWDEDRIFADAIKLRVTPFNIFVSSSLQIVDIRAYSLLKEDIVEVFNLEI